MHIKRVTKIFSERSRKRTFALLGSIASTCLIAFIAFRCSRNPAGTYVDRTLSVEGGAFWVFKAGSASVVTDGREQFVGYYREGNGKWVITSPGKSDAEDTVVPGPFGITLVPHSLNQKPVFLPRRCFAWAFSARCQ
jgi:hypothetical protein